MSAEHDAPSEDSSTQTPKSPIFHADAPDTWEWWTRAALLLFVVTALMWLVVGLRLGEASVRVYGALPVVGFVGLPIVFVGLWRSMTRPPVLRRSRTIAFGLLLAVTGVTTKPLIPAPVSTEGYRSQHSFALPFQGRWLTLSGGDALETNLYATSPPLRWAYAFSKVDDQGKTHQGEGKKLEDFHCFGAPVLSPVDAVVEEVSDGAVDNPPGETATYQGLGNHVVLRLERDEYLFLSHLKKDSILVQAGDKVRAGQALGACGNSGWAVKPRLTVHLQNGPSFPYNEGLYLAFRHYRVGGDVIDEGQPLGNAEETSRAAGQIVEPVKKTDAPTK